MTKCTTQNTKHNKFNLCQTKHLISFELHSIERQKVAVQLRLHSKRKALKIIFRSYNLKKVKHNERRHCPEQCDCCLLALETNVVTTRVPIAKLILLVYRGQQPNPTEACLQ